MESMPGILDAAVPESVRASLERYLEIIRELRRRGPSGRSTLFWSDKCPPALNTGAMDNPRLQTNVLIDTAKRLRRCCDLSKQFKPIARDRTATRQARSSDGRVVTIPLIFSMTLPAKRSVRLTAVDQAGRPAIVTAQTPDSIPEVSRAIKEHGKKFDRLEIWWVPNEVLIEPLRVPDPVLVGYLRVPGTEGVYLELHRWVDESVESGYWAREAY